MIFYYTNFTENRKQFNIPDNLYKTIGPVSDVKNILPNLEKKIEMYICT